MDEERIIPGKTSYKHYRLHLMRYVFVGKIVENKIVLDVACGVGYGSKYLYNCKAREVIGIDISRDAVKYATKKYEAKNVNYLCMDATRLGIRNDVFDVVCSMETIEHVDYHNFLAEIQRILKPDGLFIVSSPTKEVHSRYSKKPLNPFHLKEFSIIEFYNLLKKWFNDVKLYGQKFSIISNLWAVIPYGPKIAHFIDVRLMSKDHKQNETAQTEKILKEYKDQVKPLQGILVLRPSFIIAVCKRKKHKS